MLAESVEDRIFELVDELDELVKKHGGLENLPDDIREESGKQNEDTRRAVSYHVISWYTYIISHSTSNSTQSIVEMAKQTRALQIQYDDLVNGRPSVLLDMEDSD